MGAQNLNVADARKEVILSDSKAFSLYKTRYMLIGFLMLTTDFNTIEVKTSVALNVGSWYTITVTKTLESLCIACEMTNSPSVPIGACTKTTAIMVPVGDLSYGEGLLGKAKDFGQDFSLGEALVTA